MKNPILQLLAISWRLRRHFVALCATQLITNYFPLNTKAQAPQGIPYQAIARNASGVAIANTAVKVRFSIRDSIANGAIKYQETHNPTTSALGLFSVNVGMGMVVNGTFSGINWSKNAKFLQVELNTTGGTTYTDLGTTQMMSVPYALQANSIKMRTSASGDTLYTGGGNYLIIPGLSASNPVLYQPDLPITDIDGNVYQTIRIGNQVWMKENLKVSKYRNGNSISTGLTDSQWSVTTNGAYTLYNNDVANNAIYGKLYNWYTISDARGLCPIGWHVPSDDEWKLLETILGLTASEVDAIGPRGIAQKFGGKLKSIGIKETGSGLWETPNIGANNSSGFSGIPGGTRYDYGAYNDIGRYAVWWTRTEFSSASPWYRYLFYNDNGLGRDKLFLKNTGFSVRCIKD
jgi:uncharacterized protein (TIGR02145 family)